MAASGRVSRDSSSEKGTLWLRHNDEGRPHQPVPDSPLNKGNAIEMV